RPEGEDRRPVVARERHVRERAREALPEVELRPALEPERPAEAHGPRRIEQDVDGEVLLLDEELQEEMLEPRVRVPVDRPEVVAGRVLAVVREFDGAASPARAPLPARLPGEDAPRDDLQ